MSKQKIKTAYFILLVVIFSSVLLGVLWKPMKDRVDEGLFSPVVNISSPADDSIIKTQKFTLSITAYDPDGTIDWVHYYLKQGTTTYPEYDVPLKSGSSYQVVIDVGDSSKTIYKTGDYELYAKAHDNEGGSNTDWIDIRISILISIEIPEENITYDQTDVICDGGLHLQDAYCYVYHNSTFENERMLLTLPTDYADARGYEIWRESHYFDPLTISQDTATAITEWNLESYQASDKVLFKLRNPYYSAQKEYPIQYINTSTNLRELRIEFTIFSPHDYQGISVLYKSNYNLQNFGAINWIAYQRILGQFVEVEPTDLNIVVNEFLLSLTFSIDALNKSESAQFQFVGQEMEGGGSGNSTSMILALGITAGVATFWILFTTRRSGNNNSFKQNKPKLWWGLTIGIIGGAFLITYFGTANWGGSFYTF